MLAVVADDAPGRQQCEETPHRFADHRRPIDTPIATPGYDEYFAGALGLLHPQPVLCAANGLRGGRKRRAEVQGSGPPETKLVEGVLQRPPNHVSAATNGVRARRAFPGAVC